ncbi:ATP-dependent RNA helicase DHX29-like [Mya arenaria]|uniref:ATP-dependent RNA helicase DHX29-like n=1 Tax=Mya arenaria TaxID=6604 RepID=UPI0022E5AC29|nr:ATP-dependent RNA helicase DHX29-like [Mya arenaria]
MGKKKQQSKEQRTVKEEKATKKTYSLPSNPKDGQAASEQGNLSKVTLPSGLERELLDLIQTANQKRPLDKEVSKRLTQKKLVDIYTNLSNAGFTHKQIEQSMENTILHGGDLIDALDWLCLNLPNDKLPSNFSAAMQQEEDRMRPKFDVVQQVLESSVEKEAAAKPLPQKKMDKESAPDEVKVSSKDWILQYAQQDSDSESGVGDSDSENDPNERYLELTALLLDAKNEASELKQAGNKAKLKDVSKKIREYIIEMDSLEKDPRFNPEVKLQDIDSDKAASQQAESAAMSHDKSHVQSCDQTPSCDPREEDNDEDLGLDIFQQAEEEKPAPKEKTEKTDKKKADIRSFEYTRQQWTGKSPKQFLIDWVRKHLPKSPPPKYEKKNARGNHFKCVVRIERPKEGRLELCPEILCNNVKEAEHLASTLALYNLCKGQSVYQLLPPPFRDVWLEWADQEKQAAQEENSRENKPRDTFLAKLFSRVQISDKGSKVQGRSEVKDSEDDVLESWENFEEAEDLPDRADEKNNRSLKRAIPFKNVKESYMRNQQSKLYTELLETRQQLPVYQHKDTVLESLQQHNVVLVAGETGSGKSTQVPHFVLEACLSQGIENCNIVCTEPRRISTTSLAARVSQEMGEARMGGPDSLCGYQIRFESKCGPKTRLTYCTTGVLLRKLQLDTSLSHISHIIVDEVHERSVQSDFLLIVLKRLLNQRSDLKVILMSATLDAQKFSAYFKHCPVINIPGRTFPVQVYHVEDVVEQTGYVLDDDSHYALNQSQLVQEESASLTVTEKGGNQSQLNAVWSKDDIGRIDNSNLSPEKYCLKTRNTVTRMNMKRINMDLVVDILLHIEISPDYADMTGAVLIFLPGMSDITELYETLTSDRRFTENNKYRVIALHSALSSADQAQAFTVPPAGMRKVVLATNIAETGITIPDVVFVIDTGKVKENRYIESSQMSALEEVYISRANAKQRQGRAGRVQSGVCFRLFTKHMYEGMKPYTIPELLRVPLEELCLHIMKSEYGKPEVFLSKALDPPQPQMVNRAMSLLHSIGACEEGERLSPLGHHLAALPVHVRIGKMLLYAAVFGCLEPVAVIAASMTDKSPFVVPIGKLDMVNAAKQALAIAASDQLTIYKAYSGWREARSKGRQAEMTYCQRNFLKRNTLLEIENVKTDLIKLLSSIGFTNTTVLQSTDIPKGELEKDGVLQISKHKTNRDLDKRTISKVKAILTAGLYPNVAKVTYEAPVDAAVNPDNRVCVAETAQGPAHVHPSSVNRNLQANGWILFHEKVKSTRVYLRDSTLVSAYPLLLFGGEIHVQHTDQLLSVDDRIVYKAYAKTGVIFRELRKLLDDLLATKLEEPALNISDDPLVGLIQDLLVSEKTR